MGEMKLVNAIIQHTDIKIFLFVKQFTSLIELKIIENQSLDVWHIINLVRLCFRLFKSSNYISSLLAFVKISGVVFIPTLYQESKFHRFFKATLNKSY